MEELKHLLEDIKNAHAPTSQLVEEGRTDVIIANGTVSDAKKYILDINNAPRRQALIAKNMPLFIKE